jgi:hypothetical protein
MVSRAKHGWSALQNAFTTSKFSASAGDALMPFMMRHGCVGGSAVEQLPCLDVHAHGRGRRERSRGASQCAGGRSGWCSAVD